MLNFPRDVRLIFVRNLTRHLRNPMWIIVGLLQPILYLLLFAPLLDGLRIPGFSQTSSLNGFVPGLMIMLALFATGFAGSGLLPDLQAGVIERFRVTPASRPAMLLGMLLPDVLIFMVQCVLLVVVATLMGMRPDPLGLVFILVLMGLLGLMMASLSYAIALIFKNQGTLAAMISTLTQPLMLLSGVLLPLTLAPKFLQTLAQFNPFAHAVDAARALVNASFSDPTIPVTFVIVIVLAALSILWTTRIFREATA